MDSEKTETSDVFHTLDEAAAHLESPVVTIGNFDGVHMGHRTIFRRVDELACDAGVRSVALTFSPHPVRFFRPDVDEFRLTTDRQKFRLIREAGIDHVVALRFDQNVASLSPSDFVGDIIDNGLRASKTLVGANFRFGKNRAGSTDDLVRLCSDRGIDTEICEEVEYDGDTVSSTRIRQELSESNVRYASKLLERNHTVEGLVVKGEQRGRDLGFPTANIEPENLVPGDGIYATFLHIPGESPLPSATSIGYRPTFEGDGRTIECFVLDREDLDLYGEGVELEFVQFVRPELEFEGSEALVEQMHEDVRDVRSILED